MAVFARGGDELARHALLLEAQHHHYICAIANTLNGLTELVIAPYDHMLTAVFSGNAGFFRRRDCANDHSAHTGCPCANYLTYPTGCCVHKQTCAISDVS